MATKSILKNINIQRHDAATKLVNALEYAYGKSGKEIQISRTVSELKSEADIRKFFGAAK